MRRAQLKVAEPADKPGSVRRLHAAAIIPLGAASPLRSSNLPGDSAGRLIVSLFGLAPGGVCRAGLLPDSRCALTAPFHPCLCPATPLPSPVGPGRLRRQVRDEAARARGGKGVTGPSAVSFCCTFRRLSPPRRYLAPCPVEPGLSSAPFPVTRLPGRLRQRPLYGGGPSMSFRARSRARFRPRTPRPGRSGAHGCERCRHARSAPGCWRGCRSPVRG